MLPVKIVTLITSAYFDDVTLADPSLHVHVRNIVLQDPYKTISQPNPPETVTTRTQPREFIRGVSYMNPLL